MTTSDFLADLQWRGLITHSTDLDALDEALAAGPVTFYAGFDPSAPSIHMGNMLVLVTMRRLQKAGHRPICLVGGSTGLVGDARESGERELKDPALVADWVARIQRQCEPFLDFTGPNAAVMVNNLDWTKDLTLLDFLRDVGKKTRVSTMLRKDIVARRLESGEGISYAEFTYQLLQGMDFRELYRMHGCQLQIGGQDQWGNLIAGVDLIHYSEPDARVHCFTGPLLTDASGAKFGKSEGNAIWLDPELTSPYAWYQFWLNIEDASVVTLLKAFTERSREEIEALEAAVSERPWAREAQKALAHDLTVLNHGADTEAAVAQASLVLFGGGDPATVPPATWRQAVSELPSAPRRPGMTIVDALVETGLAEGRNAARRIVAEGGVALNGIKVSEADDVLQDDSFATGGVALLRRGRKNLAVVLSHNTP